MQSVRLERFASPRGEPNLRHPARNNAGTVHRPFLFPLPSLILQRTAQIRAKKPRFSADIETIFVVRGSVDTG